MDTLPAPDDDRVVLVQVPGRYVVVVGFAGFNAQVSIDAAERAISELVVAKGLLPVSPVTFAGYSAPSVPDAQKKWEVYREIKSSS